MPNFLKGITSAEQEQIKVDQMIILNTFKNHSNLDIYVKMLHLKAMDYGYLHEKSIYKKDTLS